MATKTKKTPKDKYKPNQFVVHPHHGAAKVIRKVNKNVEVFVEGEPKSKRIQYFEIEVLTDGLLVMVPVDSVDEVIRPVISKNAVSKKVFPIFKEKPEEAGTNWSRWYKVLTEKMTSGDVIQVAEVVRDLTHAQINKGISPALKRMLAKARMTLASEIACALNVDEETAIDKINQQLPEEDPEDGL
ncbi:MAG: CarD family transcriptional regulator [Actinobacteria bacterium]|jgi:CarD family transcriptional regulator|nr:CarD family transcriptional regulator [bacterium]MBS92666.1 CarD family transcriptional regulator [Actinomycetota bacterium]MDC2988521.1 CarD family transcriptional regulator [Acidimicrobiaceae bacterium]|tara:strand:- start:69 stop:626 length:558 start_codon:yes stop_codon:yes gene_type:complete